MVEALLYAFFGSIAGAGLYAAHKTNQQEERRFAAIVSLVVIVLIIATSWQTTTARRESFERHLFQIEEDAYDEGYDAGWRDGYDDYKHTVLRRGSKYMTEDELSELEWYLE